MFLRVNLQRAGITGRRPMKTWRNTAGQAGVLFFFLMLLVGFLALPGCTEKPVQTEALPTPDTGKPSAVAAGDLQPGLAVIYFHDKYRHIKELPEGKRIKKYAHPGPPVLKLDHKFGRGKVFDSGRKQSVGMLMTGFFLLEQPGEYQFQSNSNDGFRMLIKNTRVVDDPTVHPDKLSDPGSFTVRGGGFFPVTLKYFQRKGTATLQLFWKEPGADTFSIVPSSVYFHKP